MGADSGIDLPGYRIIRTLGSGGAARVFLAEETSSGHSVAIKLLFHHANPESRSRFEREIALVQKLRHPGIIRIVHTGYINEQPFLIMPYMAGGDLELELGGQRCLHPERIHALISNLCLSLAYAHQQGVLHRDLKPANILFAQDRTQPILSDFGAARPEDAEHDLTRVGTTVGSPGYMSPEQIRAQPVNLRSDIYGLGIILYRMLTGTHPFHGQTALQVAVAHLEQPVPRLPTSLAQWQPILDRCLAKKPEDRFANCLELRTALDELLTQANPTDPAPEPRNNFRFEISKTGPWYLRRRHLHVVALAEDVPQFQQQMQQLYETIANWRSDYGRRAYSCTLEIEAHPWIHQRIRELLQASRQENTSWGDLLRAKNPLKVRLIEEQGQITEVELRPVTHRDRDH